MQPHGRMRSVVRAYIDLIDLSFRIDPHFNLMSICRGQSRYLYDAYAPEGCTGYCMSHPCAET